MPNRDATFNQLYDDLTELHEALFPDTGSEATQRLARRYLTENVEAIRESFRLWTKLERNGRNLLSEEHRQLDRGAADDAFLMIAEDALEGALDTGPLHGPVTDDDVNMIRRVVNYAAYSPDAARSEVRLSRHMLLSKR